jgi:CubicO group peptidase (beta-lactamase class C family)
MPRRFLCTMIILILLTSCAPALPTPTPTPVLTPDTPLEQRIARVESGLVPMSQDGQISWGTSASLAERMAFHSVPGVSVAVMNDYQIAWAKGYGLLEAGGSEAVTPETLFHAGSIAKPVSAAATLTLVEQGMLDLDEDVNAKLTSWQVPENEHTTVEKVTLRRLMSHSSGLQDGFTNRSSSDPVPSYFTPEGEAPTVTLQQMLNGDPSVDVDGPTFVATAPGTQYNYANANYAILELLVEDVTQIPFVTFMEQTVLEPLGLASMTYQQPLPVELRPRAATEHSIDGQPFAGKRLLSPFTAAGGMWTTPSDLARVAIEIMRAYVGDSGRFVSPQMVQEMLTPQVEVADGPLSAIADAVGLGLDLADEGGRLRMSMTGGTWGSTCLLWAFPQTGDGAVVMTNSARGTMLNFEVLLGLSVEYGWLAGQGS